MSEPGPPRRGPRRRGRGRLSVGRERLLRKFRINIERDIFGRGERFPSSWKKIKPGAKLTSDSSGPWSKENNFGKSFRESFRGFHAAREIARATLSYFSRRDNILFTSSVPPSGIA